MLTLNDGRSELWQWDTGRKLTVDADCSQVHFSNKVFGRSIDVDVVDGVAIIPDILLQTDKELTAWAFVGTSENGYTKISKTIKVNKRNKPADYVFTPTEQTTLDEIMEKLGRIEESQDPDAIKNAVYEYLANNPIQIEEEDPTVPDWAKQPAKPKYTAQEVKAVATVNGNAPDENGNVEIEIPEASKPDMTGYATERYVQENYQPKGNYLTEHQKLKTINGQSLVGTGDISIISSGSVNYDATIKSVNHRGYSKEAPENTIPAYILSKQKGYNYVECDVSFTSDGIAVLLHDETIDRTSNGSGNISELTYEQVSKYDFGYWFANKYKGTRIPTFEEFIMYCRGLGLHPYIELKTNGGYTQEQIKQLTDIVEAHGMKGKVTYISFSSTFLEYVKECDKKARLGFISDINDSSLSTAVGLKTGENEVFMDCNYTYVTASKVTKCMENDLPLEVWTVNQASVIERLNPYINGVTSDNQNAGKILSNKYSTYTYSEDTDSGDTGGDSTGGEDTGGDGGDTGNTTYTVTNNLKNVTSSNSDTSVEKGASYTANISVPEGYVVSSVSVVMGGTDITASAYVDGVISIDSVSGNVVITIVASDSSYEVVRTIAQDELSVGKQLSGNSPYYNDSKNRISYIDFDLVYEDGYTYKFDFISGNNLEYSIGIQWYNQIAMNGIASKVGLLSNTYDPGWQRNGVEMAPEPYKNSPIVAYRLTFKRNNGTSVQNGDITSVIISRKKSE